MGAGSRIVSTGKAPAAVGPYSQAVAAGKLLFVSGQIPLDPETGAFVEGGIADQVHRIVANMRAILNEAGGDLEHVVKTTIFVMDMADFKAVNEAYAEHFGSILPARSTVQVAGLPLGARVEMEAVAVLP